MEGDPVLNQVSVVSLLATVAYILLGVIVTHIFGKKLPAVDKFILIWLVFDVLIHLTLEGPFLMISMLGTVNNSSHFTALTWKEYARADARWGVSDPTIVSLELLTVTIVELSAIVLVYAILKNTYYRHFCQIFLCVCELYGGWMTFCPEWLTDSKNLNTEDPILLWLYLVFFNMLWVVIPLGMLWHSWVALKMALCLDGNIVTVKQETIVTTNTTRTYDTRSKKNKKEV